MTTSNVSILIPSFKNKEHTLKCVEFAIKNNPGEIIVSEDAGDKTLISDLEKLKCTRLKFFFQEKNLGLWKNHLFLLKQATKPWIKLMQSDDLLLPGALKKMCENIGENTAIVSYLPIYRNLSTGEDITIHRHTRILKFNSKEFVSRIAEKGNELSRPSNCLYRANLLSHDEEAWRNDMSCDFVINAMAGSKGEVIILPPGGVITGVHYNQDGAKQTYALQLARWLNTLTYIRKNGSNEVIKSFNILSLVEFYAMHRVFIGYFKNRQHLINGMAFKEYFRLWQLTKFSTILSNPKLVWRYFKFKYKGQII